MLLLGLMLAPLDALAAKTIVYIHGRSMNFWPSAALMGHDSSWGVVNPSFNGSSRLNDASARFAVKNAIANACTGGNVCVVACYSAGCARTLLALDDLRAVGTPATGVQWLEAAGSAAGGSPLSDISTNGAVRLLTKLFISGAPSSAPIDQDLGVGTMRGTYGFIQNAAPGPVYHLAGSGNICNRLKIKAWVSIGLSAASYFVVGPVGWVLSALGSLFGSASVKVCGNSYFPGNYGDGAVPVHSAAGYSDTGAHATHCDGDCTSSKYVFRAYEQVPLFPQDHRSILAPLVQYGSVRMAVPTNATCANHPNGSATDPDASIVYQDADGALAEESKPLYLLQLCGNDVWNGEATEYSTCFGTSGCCSNFSSGTTDGCSCGEGLCVQSKYATRSYFTGTACDGVEYSDGAGGADYRSWDGAGMVGQATTSVVIRSIRNSSGTCQQTVRKVTHRNSCPEYYGTTLTLAAARKVYRSGIAGYSPDPNVRGEFGGYVVSSSNLQTLCP
jgi:hypothetical protein